MHFGKLNKLILIFIYIEVPVPPLDELYSRSNEMESMGNSIEFIRWKLFGWIMSFSDTIIVAIRQLPKTFSLICATLYALVKVNEYSHIFVCKLEFVYNVSFFTVLHTMFLFAFFLPQYFVPIESIDQC